MAALLYQWYGELSVELTNLDDLLQLRLRREIPWSSGGNLLFQGEDLLEAIDATLFLVPSLLEDDEVQASWWREMTSVLGWTLEEGGSAWCVNDDFTGLTRRVDATVAGVTAATIQAAPPDAAGHLRRAWDAAYGFGPDATKAYSEAVKAVEAVVVPVAIPNDRVGTLGKAITHIEQTAARWTLAVDQNGQAAPVDALLAMLKLVWHGQSDRHAGPNTSPVTLESAQTALHAAVTIVQWFTSGAVKKAPKPGK
ncbi:hypothetical protein [Nonomuraea sp. NPDC003214]